MSYGTPVQYGYSHFVNLSFPDGSGFTTVYYPNGETEAVSDQRVQGLVDVLSNAGYTVSASKGTSLQAAITSP